MKQTPSIEWNGYKYQRSQSLVGIIPQIGCKMFEETIVSNRSYAWGSSVEMKLSTSDRESIEKHHLIGTFEPLHNRYNRAHSS